MYDEPADFPDERRCKDVIWALAFAGVAAACLVVFAVALTLGDPSNLPPANFATVEAQVIDWATYEISILHHDLSIIFAALSCGLICTFLWIQLLKRASLFFLTATVLAFALVALCTGVYTWNLAYRNSSNFLLLVSFLCWAVAAVVLIVSYLLREKIGFTASVMQQCGHVLQKNGMLLALPFIFSVIYLILLAMWLIGFIYLFSVAEIETVETSASANYYLLFHRNIRWAFLIQLLGGLWTFSLLSAAEQYIVARVVYAFESNKQHPLATAKLMKTATKEALTTSLGSLSFGALLSSVAEVLSLFIKYSGARENIRVPEFCCLQGLTSFAQYLIQWTNGFSYVYVAAEGIGFGQASTQTFNLFREKLTQVALASLLVNYLLTMGTLFFTFLIGGVTVAAIEHYHYHIGLISVLVTFCSLYLMFHITGRLILITVNTILVYLFEDRRLLSKEQIDLKTLVHDHYLEQIGHAVRL